MKHFYTSNFAKHGFDPMGHSTTAMRPHWIPDKRHVWQLAPTWRLVQDFKTGIITKEQYKVKYLEMINRRSTPKKMVDLLPEGAILLCYEKPGDFCHRHIAADWLLQAGDVRITEIG